MDKVYLYSLGSDAKGWQTMMTTQTDTPQVGAAVKGQGRIGAEEAARGATAMGAMGKIIHKWKLHWENHGKISGKNMEQLDIIYRCGKCMDI